MKISILYICLLISFSSFAQWMHDYHFNFPTSTSDGIVRIASKNDLSGVKWVRVYVTKDGKIDDNFYAIEDGEAFDKSLPLRHGPGRYQFQIMTSKGDAKYSTYAVEHQGTIANTYQKSLDDIAPSVQVQSTAEEIVSLAQEITQGLQSDMEKSKEIHDWVAKNVAYDVDSYFQETYVNMEWDAITVLNKKKSICFGYSNLTAALHRAVGIPAKVIIGDADVYRKGWSEHAWNKVLVDGRWISMDVTWDAGGVDPDTRSFKFALSHKYFDPSPEDFAKDHREK